MIYSYIKYVTLPALAEIAILLLQMGLILFLAILEYLVKKLNPNFRITIDGVD